MKMLLLLPFVIAAETDFRVEQTFNSEPFVCREVGLEEREAYRVLDLRYPSPVKTDVEANNTVPARYFLPAGIDGSSTPRPGVVCLHILGGNFELVELTCATLARRGIPALWLKLPFYGERRPAGSKLDLTRHPDRFAAALGQGIADVRRAIDVLAARPEVDPERVNVMGISLGGIVAASTAAIDPRVNRAALLLAGGDTMTIIDEAPECRDLKDAMAELEPDERIKVERSIGQVDPLTHARSLRERAGQGRVLMINAACDEVIPRRCTERLAAALGMADRVVWLEGLGHYTALAALPQALNMTVDFFAQDLPAEARRSTADAEKNTQAGAVANGHNATEQSPLHRLVGIIQQVGVLLQHDQEPGGRTLPPGGS